ncbi:MAG TPA: ABC transporter permease [Terriglobales bacterium]|nr:ABC transporter permease [Terriglobales bacterium]
MTGIVQDLRHTLRLLRKSPAFTIIAVLTLAIGIGTNTAVFSVINGVLLRPLPYPQADRLVALWLNAPGAGGLASFSSGLQLSPSMYFTFLAHNRTFQSLGISTTGMANVTGVARPEQVRTALLSGGVLETLDVPAMVGRWFSAVDQDPRGSKTVMLSYGYWQSHFGGDSSVIGRVLQVDSQPHTIVGIMPRNFRIADHDFDLLIPLALDPVNQKLAPFGYDGIGRLKPGVSINQADADIARLIPVWMDSWSNGPGTNPHYYRIWRITPNFHSLKQQVIGNVASVLWVVMATVGLVMLIACANLANLLLVRAESRQQQHSVRAALGAGRLRIAQEMLLESLALSFIGGALAIGIARAGLRLLVALSPANLPRLAEITIDGRSLIFIFLLTIFCGVFFGAIPAWRSACSPSLTMSLSGRAATTDRARHRSRDILVIAQTTIALVLLVSAVLIIRTFAALRNVDPGFSDPAHIQTISVSIPESFIPDPLVVTRTQNSIADQIAAIPGVTSVGFAAGVPMQEFDPNWDQIRVEGKTYDGGEPPIRLYNYVSPGFFGTMGTRLIAGRDFNWADIYGFHQYVIVSESFVRDSWGSAAAAIGKRVRQFDNKPWQEVIGVVEDVRQHGVQDVASPTIYWPAMLNDPYTQQPTIDAPRSVTFVIRSSRAGTSSFISQVQQAVWAVNGNLPVAAVRTMGEIYTQSMARTAFTLVMLAIAGSMALTLSIIGTYGVISYTVSQRTREIGIRLALGSQRSRLKWMFVRSALFLTASGMAIGLCVAIVVTQSLRSLLFGITPLDPVSYGTVAFILAATALLASYLPARRATKVDPIVALRYE